MTLEDLRGAVFELDTLLDSYRGSKDDDWWSAVHAQLLRIGPYVDEVRVARTGRASHVDARFALDTTAR